MPPSKSDTPMDLPSVTHTVVPSPAPAGPYRISPNPVASGPDMTTTSLPVALRRYVSISRRDCLEPETSAFVDAIASASRAFAPAPLAVFVAFFFSLNTGDGGSSNVPSTLSKSDASNVSLTF